METERVCLDCGGPIGAGRSDKKFCSTACKTNYNNVLKAQEKPVKVVAKDEVPDYVVEVEKILRRNRAILAEICGGFGKGSVSLKQLTAKAFNYNFFTSEAEPTATTGEIYRFCFEFGYKITADSRVVVVARKNVIEDLF